MYDIDSKLFKIKKQDKILAAVSGGPDSMALLDRLRRLRSEIGFELGVAHIHHGLRAESDEELKGIRDYCLKYKIPFYCRKVNLKSEAYQSYSLEEAGRIARYAYFQELINEHGFNKLMTAHHLNDQSETLLMRLFRGTGPEGASGIKKESERFGIQIIRPFLSKTKTELRQYCDERQVPYFTDASNEEADYSRNYIRNRIIPGIEERFPGAQEHLANFAELMNRQQSFIASLLKSLSEKWLKEDVWGVNIIRDIFLSPEEFFRQENLDFLSEDDQLYLIDEIIRLALKKAGGIKDISSKHIEQIRLFFQTSQSGSLDLPNGTLALQASGEFYITKQKKVSGTFGEYPLEEFTGNKKYLFAKEGLVLNIESGHAKEFIPPQKSKGEALIKNTNLNGPLVLRHRREGDEVFLSGMNSSKKLSRYMIDKKIPRFLRESLPLLALGSTVIWIPGYYIHRDYMVDSPEAEVLKLSISEY